MKTIGVWRSSVGLAIAIAFSTILPLCAQEAVRDGSYPYASSDTLRRYAGLMNDLVKSIESHIDRKERLDSAQRSIMREYAGVICNRIAPDVIQHQSMYGQRSNYASTPAGEITGECVTDSSAGELCGLSIVLDLGEELGDSSMAGPDDQYFLIARQASTVADLLNRFAHCLEYLASSDSTLTDHHYDFILPETRVVDSGIAELPPSREELLKARREERRQRIARRSAIARDKAWERMLIWQTKWALAKAGGRSSRPAVDLAAKLMSMEQPKGESGKYKGLSWHFNFTGGFCASSFPLVASESSSSSGFGGSYSTSTSDAVGIGVLGGIEFWPFYGDNWGIGGFGGLTAGFFDNGLLSSAAGSSSTSSTSGSTLSSMNLSAHYGGRAYLGFSSFKIVIEKGGGWRDGVTSSTVEDEYSSTSRSGSAEYRYTREGIGAMVSWGGEYRTGITFMFLFDIPEFLADGAPSRLYQLDIWGDNGWRFLCDLGLKYPTAGASDYDGTPGNNHVYLVASFAKSFDFFGNRY